MSDKLRRVDVNKRIMTGEETSSGWVYPNPNGTHMLVPVETWERVVGALKQIRDHGADWIYSGAACAGKADRTLKEIGADDE